MRLPQPFAVFCSPTMLVLALGLVFAEGLWGQATPTVKQAPPPGIAVPETDAKELATSLEALADRLGGLRTRSGLWPDVAVFHKGVGYALGYGEFFRTQEIAQARVQLALAELRASELEQGKPSWASATGPLVRGYVSRIDGSVQPYGLIVPDDWKPAETQGRPLYLWFHGRSETLSEVAFMAGRLKAKREFAPPAAFELHLYGRYCNASKFAGETDAFEAMEDVARHYAIDRDRIVPLGFSMGGASVWHFATHYAGLWAAASPGAGFAETALYAKVDQDSKSPPMPWERTLYRLYDATAYAANLANTRLVVYSGEIDPQRQAAEVMKKAMAQEGLELEALVGPRTGHQYEPETKKELARRIDGSVATGRQPVPAQVRFVTYTLRYHQMQWVTLDALEQHWERAEINARIVSRKELEVQTRNIGAFTLSFPKGATVLDSGSRPQVQVDQQPVSGPPVSKGDWTAHFRKTKGKWALASAEPAGLTKHHGLTGPIDDAFMDAFLFVRPTGPARQAKVGAWAAAEMERAIVEWRRVFRGDAPVKDDRDVTAEDIASRHLVLWGDPGSNQLLAKILNRLPVQWTAEKLVLGAHTVSAIDHAPILIYPNPLNPARYVVVNSGFTFRQGSTTSNSLQTPKLPDWALIDLGTPPGLRWPGRVVEAGFFDSHWQLGAR